MPHPFENRRGEGPPNTPIPDRCVERSPNGFSRLLAGSQETFCRADGEHKGPLRPRLVASKKHSKEELEPGVCGVSSSQTQIATAILLSRGRAPATAVFDNIRAGDQEGNLRLP